MQQWPAVVHLASQAVMGVSSSEAAVAGCCVGLVVGLRSSECGAAHTHNTSSATAIRLRVDMSIYGSVLDRGRLLEAG